MIPSVSVNTPITICAAANDDFAIGLGMTLYSALANLQPRDTNVYVLDMGISAANRRRVLHTLQFAEGNVQVQWVKPDLTALRAVPASQRAAYARLLIPDIVGQHVEKAIYLDSDVIVEGNLHDLWEMDITDWLLGAVQDYATPYASSAGVLGGKYKQFGLAADSPCFNSGVMLINLAKWRQENLLAQVVANQPWSYSDLHFTDQDGFNVVAAGKWQMLDPHWNVAISLLGQYGHWLDLSPAARRAAQDELLKNALVLHFTTKKPWRLSYNDQMKTRFDQYLQKSGWFNAIEYLQYVGARSAVTFARRYLLGHISVKTKKRLWQPLAGTLRLKWLR
jgi:lipopolysaccharide biosynthesis glycosyltransferase